MSNDEHVKSNEQHINDEESAEKNDGGLKIKSNVKAGAAGDPPILVGGGG